MVDKDFRGSKFDSFLIKKQIKFTSPKRIYPIYLHAKCIKIKESKNGKEVLTGR